MKYTFSNITTLNNHSDKQNRSLLVTDFDHGKAIQIVHLDGSTFFVTNVKLEKVRYKNKSFNEVVYIIYSEHHKPFVYFESDLTNAPVLIKKPNPILIPEHAGKNIRTKKTR